MTTCGNLRFKIDWLIAGRKFTVFALFYFVKLRAISKYKPPRGLYLEGRFNGGFFGLRVWGLLFGAPYTWRGLFSEFYGTLLWASPVSRAGLFTGQARLISCFLIQSSLCLLYMRPGNEVAGLPGLPRSRLFEPRSREAPTSPPLAFEYGSRLSSLLVPLGTFHQEGGHNWLGDHTRNRKDTTFKVIFLESEISQFLFKSFHIRSLHKEKQCLFFLSFQIFNFWRLLHNNADHGFELEPIYAIKRDWMCLVEKVVFQTGSP